MSEQKVDEFKIIPGSQLILGNSENQTMDVVVKTPFFDVGYQFRSKAKALEFADCIKKNVDAVWPTEPAAEGDVKTTPAGEDKPDTRKRCSLCGELHEPNTRPERKPCPDCGEIHPTSEDVARELFKALIG